MFGGALASCALLMCLSGALPPEEDASLARVRPFLAKHCFECHGPSKQKGELRFDTLGTSLAVVKTLETWQNILDQLNLGEMPPKKKPRPALDETRVVVDLLTSTLKRAYARRRSTGGQAVIRRLNKSELRNTFRDLLYLRGEAYEPGAVSRLVDNMYMW